MHCKDFPMVFAIAMDYLAIQALSVPCEHAFSSSGEMDTVHCNRLSPVLMDALQMSKFGFSKEPFNFTKGILTDENDLAIKFDDDTDILAKLIHHEHTDTQQEDIIDRFIATEGVG
jgi:hAT family C-terminal dimerisation region